MLLKSITEMLSIDDNNRWYHLSVTVEEQHKKYLKDKIKHTGQKLTYPKKNQIQLDIDSADQYKQFKHFSDLLCKSQKKLHIVDIESTPSKSGGDHRHIVITFNKKLDPWQRCCLQLLFGSDPKREILGTIRLLNGFKKPHILIEDK